MRRRINPADSGAAAVEFALIGSLLFLLLFGIIQYGLYFFQATAMESATDRAVRAAEVGIENCDVWFSQVDDGTPLVRDSITVLSVTPMPTAARGDNVLVSITWRPTVDIGLIPLPGGDRIETATGRLERVGAATTAGCVR